MDTLLKGDCGGSITEAWYTMPPSAEKTAHTFTHTGDTINTVVVPLMLFMGEQSRRAPEAIRRRNARAAKRRLQVKGKGKGTAATRGLRVDPFAIAGFPMAPQHAYPYPYGYWWPGWWGHPTLLQESVAPPQRTGGRGAAPLHSRSRG